MEQERWEAKVEIAIDAKKGLPEFVYLKGETVIYVRCSLYAKISENRGIELLKYLTDFILQNPNSSREGV